VAKIRICQVVPRDIVVESIAKAPQQEFNRWFEAFAAAR
jgi:hypothetical protein